MRRWGEMEWYQGQRVEFDWPGNREDDYWFFYLAILASCPRPWFITRGEVLFPLGVVSRFGCCLIERKKKPVPCVARHHWLSSIASIVPRVESKFSVTLKVTHFFLFLSFFLSGCTTKKDSQRGTRSSRKNETCSSLLFFLFFLFARSRTNAGWADVGRRRRRTWITRTTRRDGVCLFVVCLCRNARLIVIGYSLVSLSCND